MNAAADVNLNALWARCIAEELVRAGVGFAVLCPGSRNSPLLFALATAFGDACLAHVDERSGAFIALGRARATGRPALICVTSGSALLNCAPALAEAHAMAIPLLVVAADRPWELHDRGAPQTMPQRGVLAPFLAAEVDLGEPLATETALRALRARVSRLAQTAGPTLLNVPLRDPLPPLPDPAWRLPEGLSAEALHGRPSRPFVACGLTSGALPPADLSWYGDGLRGCDWLRPGLRGLILAGASSGGWSANLGHLARVSGFPLLADAASGMRTGGTPNLVCLGDALLAGPLGSEAPEVVIVDGQLPLTRTAYEWLDRQTCPVLLLEHGLAPHHDRDFVGRAWATVHRPGPETYDAIARACAPGDAAWLARWLDAERRAQARRDALIAEEPWGEVLAAAIVCDEAPAPMLHLASSMPIRHANLLLRSRGDGLPAVHANRGLNGIDGTIGTFLGEASAMAGTLLCGDLAFLHDLPALGAWAAFRRADEGTAPRIDGCSEVVDSAIVVLNNDGGGIFDFLAVAQVPGYERWVRTPHGLDCAGAAAQFGLDYRRVADAAALRAALREHVALVECDVRGGCVDRHRRLLRLLAEA